MAVPDGQILGLVLPVDEGQPFQITGRRPQDTVDQTWATGILAVFPGQLHRLVHCGAGRNLGQKGHLIDAQAQRVEHPVFQPFYLYRGEFPDIEVTEQLVLKHAETEPGGQRRIPAVQSRLSDVLFQGQVGPGPLLFAGGQGHQGHFTGARHTCHISLAAFR